MGQSGESEGSCTLEVLANHGLKDRCPVLTCGYRFIEVGEPSRLRSGGISLKRRLLYWTELMVHEIGAPRRYCPDLSALEAQRITFVLVAH